jgi:hypothetical protein
MQKIKSFTLSFERPKESLAKKSRPLPYNCLKIARNGCKNLTPRPTEVRCRASSNRNSCYAIAHNFFNGNYTKAGCFFRFEKFLTFQLVFYTIFVVEKHFGQHWPSDESAKPNAISQLMQNPYFVHKQKFT